MESGSYFKLDHIAIYMYIRYLVPHFLIHICISLSIENQFLTLAYVFEILYHVVQEWL